MLNKIQCNRRQSYISTLLCFRIQIILNWQIVCSSFLSLLGGGGKGKSYTKCMEGKGNMNGRGVQFLKKVLIGKGE